MPDYDPTSIPILNDVIDTDESVDTELDKESAEHEAIADDITPGLFEAEPVAAEVNINLSEESVDSETALLVSEATRDESSFDGESEPEIGIIDDIVDEDSSDGIAITGADAEELIPEDGIIISADNTTPETADIESALIDHSASEEETVTETADVDTETQPVEQKQHASLESMVDDITKELMPDLEQQLRYLIQQALEDRLPDDVIKQLIDDKDKPN